MSRVSYSVDSSVATVVLDDGKVNVLSPAMQEEIHGALDSAGKDDAGAHGASKLRARSEALDAIRAAVRSEFGQEPRR